MASNVCGVELPSTGGGMNIIFWEQLVSPLFRISGCLEAVPSVTFPKKPLGFRTALVKQLVLRGFLWEWGFLFAWLFLQFS